MKVQCSCGAKFAFEITSEMRTNPVRFVCRACGLDASEFVDGLIRQELGQTATPPGRVVAVQARTESPAGPTSQSVPNPAAPQQPALRVRINSLAAPVSEPARIDGGRAGSET